MIAQKANIKEKSITVGIPVYNEAANIVKLIDDLFKSRGVVIAEVIVYNDASTDETLSQLKEAKKIYGQHLTVINAAENNGKSYALNKLFAANKSDIFVTLDSDLRVFDDKSISRLIDRMRLKGNVGLASGWYTYKNANSFMGRVFEFSATILCNVAVYKPFYGCSGGLMAFDKSFIASLNLPEKIHRIDGYLYMKCRQDNREYAFVREALVQDDKNFSKIDLKKYTNIQARSQSFPEVFKRDFSARLLEQELKIPLSVALKAFIKAAITRPIEAACYVYAKSYSTLVRKFRKQVASGQWRG